MSRPPFDPDQLVTVRSASAQGVTVLEVAGEVDMATADAMAAPLFAHLNMAPPDLVVDLSKVDFLGSAGLAVLVTAYRQAKQGITRLALVADRSVVLRPLQIAGLADLVPIHRSMSDAVAAAGRPVS